MQPTTRKHTHTTALASRRGGGGRAPAPRAVRRLPAADPGARAEVARRGRGGAARRRGGGGACWAEGGGGQGGARAGAGADHAGRGGGRLPGAPNAVMRGVGWSVVVLSCVGRGQAVVVALSPLLDRPSTPSPLSSTQRRQAAVAEAREADKSLKAVRWESEAAARLHAQQLEGATADAAALRRQVQALAQRGDAQVSELLAEAAALRQQLTQQREEAQLAAARTRAQSEEAAAAVQQRLQQAQGAFCWGGGLVGAWV